MKSASEKRRITVPLPIIIAFRWGGRRRESSSKTYHRRLTLQILASTIAIRVQDPEPITSLIILEQSSQKRNGNHTNLSSPRTTSQQKLVHTPPAHSNIILSPGIFS
jgi:hypothetical protein